MTHEPARTDRRSAMEKLSDQLKRRTIQEYIDALALPGTAAAAYFKNTVDGPQFAFANKIPVHDWDLWHPLYLTPAHAAQQPSAWLTKLPNKYGGRFVAIDRARYHPDIVWLPLFTAR
jgi:hypothetical protein